jgi:sugar lactone lactonase YvrE
MRRLLLAVTLTLPALAAGCASGEEKEAARQAAVEAPGLQLPLDVEVDPGGRIYIADALLHRVLRHDPETGETVVVAGSGERGSSGDGGQAVDATLEEPLGLGLDPEGNLYVADFPANRIRRIDPSGRITTLAGTGREGRSGDGGPAASANLGLPAAAVVDPTGRYLVVPTLGNYVRRVDLETETIDTLAGDGAPATTGEGGPAVEASVESPHGAAYDDAGNLYLPDGPGYLRRIDVDTGVIETVAGVGTEGASGDGGAATRAAIDVSKLVVGPDGSLYLVGGDPGGGEIRRIAADGTIETVVGTGVLGEDGDGLLATELGILPSDIAIAPDGALVFSQTEPEPAVRRVDPETGLVTTLVR